MPDFRLNATKSGFAGEVLPQLEGLKLREITEAAGCSKSYASVIRSGSYIPHLDVEGVG